MEFLKEIYNKIEDKEVTKQQLNNIKIELCRKYNLKKIPTDIEIYLNAPKKLRKKLVLTTKPVRTASGVAVVAVMTKPIPCPHGKCIYCPGGLNSNFGDTPQSYTGNEPATMRGKRANYDPYIQVFNRLEQYIVLNQNPEKVEIIIMGGTFTSFEIGYQNEFIKYIYKALNDFSELFYTSQKTSGENKTKSLNLEKFKIFFELPGSVNNTERTKKIQEKIKKLKQNCNLEKEKERNETSKIRCVGLTIETKPDQTKLEQANMMLEQGCTRVELGIQTVYDEILKKINRGYNITESKKSIRILKDLGFKLNFHYMPGLPGLDKNRKKDVQGMKELFKNPDFRPDMLKIYPCMVFEGTPLHQLWKQGKFKPLDVKEAAIRIVEFIPFVPDYCRIMRVQRDIPTKYSSAGVEKTNLRQYIEKLMKEKNIVSRDIRSRQPPFGFKFEISQIEIKIIEYDSSGGKEFFISAEVKDKILGFARLRFVSQSLRKEITKNSAIIRELHVYGQATPIGKEGKETQHKGIGKKLMQKAEEICKVNNIEKLLVISGVGVREYYRKLGYKNEGPYVSKIIN